MTDSSFANNISDIPLRITIPLVPGDVVTVAWTNVVVNSPCGPYYYNLFLGTNGGDGVEYGGFPSSQLSGSKSFTVSHGSSELWVVPFTDSWCSDGTMFGITVDVDQVGNCQYGTRPKLTTSAIITLTPDVLLGALGGLGLGYLYQVLTGFLFQQFIASELCDGPPPTFPDISLDTLHASPEQLLTLVKAVLWAQYCECRPGTPAPIPFPNPGAPQPTGWPSAPTFPCDNVDPCSALVSIQQMLAQLLPIAQQSYVLTTLTQRYETPFATIAGPRHVSLSGEGSFAVSRLIGVSVVLEDFPGSPTVLEGNPPYVMNLGWISVSDGDGMLQEKRFTQQAMTWFPSHMQMATLLGYSFRPGVVATITELLAEP